MNHHSRLVALFCITPFLGGCEMINAWGEAAQKRDMARYAKNEEARKARREQDRKTGRYSGKLEIAIFFESRGNGFKKMLTNDQFKQNVRAAILTNPQFSLYPEHKLEKKLGTLLKAPDRTGTATNSL